MTGKGAALLLLGFWVGCQPDATQSAWVVLELPRAASQSEAASLGAAALKGASASASELVLEVEAGGDPFGVPLSGLCQQQIRPAELSAGQTHRVPVRPLIELGPSRPELGFDAKFSLRVQVGCAEVSGGTLSWRQSAGEPIKDWQLDPDGKGVRGKTPSLSELFEEPLPWGVVPISARQQGRATIEVTWRGPAGETARDSVDVAAMARSRGLPNVPVGTHVLLGGTGWRLQAGPNQTSFQPGPPALLFANEVGTWDLVDQSGRSLRIKSARYDQVPLDCTRSECHQDQAAYAQNLMSTVFVRGSHGLLGEEYPSGCALGCHTLGEPGTHDGGFVHVAAELGVSLETLPRHESLPPALQRLANVGCLSCHGPAAIPEEGARHLVLDVGLCAFCHDAPPRYGHVAAWRASRMARSDANPLTREPGCRDCHTSAGFIEWQSAGTPVGRHSDQPMGIGCAACHSVHQKATEPHLIRHVAAPELLSERALSPSTRLCSSCHTPPPALASKLAAPAATAGALWAGVGGIDRQGQPLKQEGPHAELGCVDCHRAGDRALERGAGHRFQADAHVCAECHATRPHVVDASFAARLEAMARALSLRAEPRPHAAPPEIDLRTATGRASYDLLLLLEDPAALAHNAPYARLLLKEAEEMLASAPKPPGSAP